MNFIKIFFIVISLASSNISFGNSQFSEAKIKSIVAHDFGKDILIKLSTNVNNNESCQINNILVLEKTHPSFEEMYSALLSEFHANTTIMGWVHSCHSFKSPKITRLDLVK